MCCTNVSASFLTFSIITYLAIFACSLLNMIFSILTPGTKETFKMIDYVDYSRTYYLSLLFNMDFGTDLLQRDDYGLTNEIKSVCYTGYCKDYYDSYSTPNCTMACFNGANYCFDEEKNYPCPNVKCEYSYYNRWGDKNYKCINHNIIYKWKNTYIKKEKTYYEFIPLEHIINKGKQCPEGYKQCGKLNSKDYLCLDEDYGCPINDIVVDGNSSPPSGYNYKTKILGDKFIHFTNENINGFMYRDLYVYTDVKKNSSKFLELIDTDTFPNFYKDNPYIYDGDYNKYSNNKKTINPNYNAYLNKVNYQTGITLDQMKKAQEEYISRAKIYNSKKIEEMNENVGSYTGVLMAFGIASFSAFAGIAIIFIPIYSSYDCGEKCSKDCDCGICQNITPMKRVLLFYLICSPTVIFSIFGFFVTLSKKSTYAEYSLMDYIEDYKNYIIEDNYSYYDDDEIEKYVYFDKSVAYNSAQFWVLLIIVIFLIVYPILVFLTSLKREQGPSMEDINAVTSSNKKKKTK